QDIAAEVGILQRPLLRRLSDGIVFLSGRDYAKKEVVVFLSLDDGATFGSQTVIDWYNKDGAYTGAVQIADNTVLLVFYSDQRETEAPDLVQVIVTIVK
ncbi:MAG: hypothetical protein HN368_18800, partial [Spirochaetales bacterium]|nr:hypothetical protein [Spirochaetales bacterium]